MPVEEELIHSMVGIHIGTSGWHYRHWKGPVYPQDLTNREFLTYYSQRFSTVEINNSFYRLPDASTFEEWVNTVPDDFIFSVKASRYITHMKKLKDPRQPVEIFFDRVASLGGKLGPILFQLPPGWHVNQERLEYFLSILPSHHRYAFEFRDPSWFHQDVYQILERHDAAFCIYHLRGDISPKQITAGFIYIRLHGPVGAYGGSYSSQDLSTWAGLISTWSRQGKEIYCYFDNDQAGYAVRNASELIEMLG